MSYQRNSTRACGQWRGDAGTALFLVVGFLVALMISSGAFFKLMHNTMSHTHDGERRQVCLNLAEGGLDKALAELGARPDEYRGEQDTPLGPGMFSTEVRPGERQRTYHIVSTGFLRGGSLVLGKARVAADVALGPRGAVLEMRWTEVRSW